LSYNPAHLLGLRLRVVFLSNLGRDREAREAYQRYAAQPGKKISTVAEYRAYLARSWKSPDPAWNAVLDRAPEAMRKAGMPEE
jgi:hypothetical protein